MRLSDLRDKEVKTLDGVALGRVHEVHVENGKVVALTCGAGSFIERLTAKARGRRIPWECVRRIEADRLVVTAHRRSTKKASASRSLQGTRRPSAPRSKR